MLFWGDFVGKINFAVRPQYANFMIINGTLFIFFITKRCGIRRLQKCYLQSPLRSGEIEKTKTNKQTNKTNKQKKKRRKKNVGYPPCSLKC